MIFQPRRANSHNINRFARVALHRLKLRFRYLKLFTVACTRAKEEDLGSYERITGIYFKPVGCAFHVQLC